MPRDTFFHNTIGAEPWELRGTNDARIKAAETSVADHESRLDDLDAAALTTTLAQFRWVATAGNTTSAGYVDFPGAINVAFTKRATASLLLVHMAGASYCSVLGNMVSQIGVQINGTDMDVCYFFHNATGRHDGYAAISTGFSGLAAGAYAAKMRWRMGGAGGQINVDGNDLFSLLVQEVG